MPRTTFFSFHYQDVESFRVNVVRNSSMFKKSDDASSFVDGSLWESAKLRGKAALRNLIDNSMVGTSTTAVLIGSETHERPWVKYELVNSFIRGNAILGIHLNRIREANTQKITAKGLNPLDRLAVFVPDDYKVLSFLELVNGRWQSFLEIPTINNRKVNTVHFLPTILTNLGMGPDDSKRRIKFSELFNTYCWTTDGGYNNLANWIETAHQNRVYKL